MVRFQETLSPDAQDASHRILCVIFLHSVSRAATSKMAHRLISTDTAEVLVQCFQEDGWAGVVQYCGHLGVLTWHRFVSYVKNYVYVEEISRPESSESKKISRWTDNKRYAAASTAGSGTSSGHAQVHERCTRGNLLITYETAWGAL
jgi:hypothetical protein